MLGGAPAPQAPPPPPGSTPGARARPTPVLSLTYFNPDNSLTSGTELYVDTHEVIVVMADLLSLCSLLAVEEKRFAKIFVFLSAIAHISLFPLLHQPAGELLARVCCLGPCMHYLFSVLCLLLSWPLCCLGGRMLVLPETAATQFGMFSQNFIPNMWGVLLLVTSELHGNKGRKFI